MLASYNFVHKNETPTKGAGDHEKLLYRRVKKCLYQQTGWSVDKTKLHRNGGMEIPRLGGKWGRGGSFINLTEPHSQQDFIVLVLAYFYKNSQLAEEKIRHFIETLPKALNKTAMTTYDLIQNKGIELGIQIGIERERQRVEEIMQLAQQKENELIMRAEEERQRTDKTILYLYQIDHKTPEEIAMIVSKDLAYVETLISNSEKENIADN
jgi:hypothetical protein